MGISFDITSISRLKEHVLRNILTFKNNILFQDEEQRDIPFEGKGSYHLLLSKIEIELNP